MERTGRIRIKFCGLTRFQDAVEAVNLGVDMLGFNFYHRSPRYLAHDDGEKLIERLRNEMGDAMANVQLVGVFVNSSPSDVSRVMEKCHLDLAQLSGDEAQMDMDKYGDRSYKAIRSDGHKTLVQIGKGYVRHNNPPTLLVDATQAGSYGGTGLTADWYQAGELARQMPILLAGGLTSSNVKQAVREVQPWGVDVASGIEKLPGVKDIFKMKDFVQAVHEG